MSEATRLATDFIASIEGFSSRAYPDPIHGWAVPTIGYGTTRYPDGSPVQRNDVKSEAYLRGCLQDYIVRHVIPELQRIPTWTTMTPYQQAALISFGYNLGSKFYRGSNRKSITRLLENPSLWTDLDYVVTTFAKYRNPGTNVENGLRRRRFLEADMFLHKGD